MVKYVVVNEVTHKVEWFIENPNTYEIYADQALEIMKKNEDYDPAIHRLYLKVGGQDEGE